MAERTFLLNWLGAVVVCAGCASFNPTTQVTDLIKAQQPTATLSKEDIELSVEEYISAEKSRKAFDADLASSGVLAFLLRFENRSSTSYFVEQKSIRAHVDQEALPQLQGVDAARQAATSGTGAKAAAWTLAAGPLALLFWPATISASGLHTSEVNQRIENHFRNFELGNLQIKPNQTLGGFVFFGTPNGTKEFEKLTLEIPVIEESHKGTLDFKLVIPNLRLSYSW